MQVGSAGRGAGAVLIWDASGLVLTNDHVGVGRRPGWNIRVTLPDGRSSKPRSRGAPGAWTWRCCACGSAPGDLRAAPVGDSDSLRGGGELVYAVGHPWGRLAAVTAAS